MNKHTKKMSLLAAMASAACFALGAEWISGGYVPPAETDLPAFFHETPNDIVRRSFDAGNVPIRRATWRVAAPGMRDLFVNGTRVTSTALPPLTPYGKRILEESFDVTRYLRSGANTLQVELGNGWWNLLPLAMWYRYRMRETMAQGIPCVKATLEIEYADGTRKSIETGADWQAASGKIVKNSIYLGVCEDARREIGGWKSARVVKGPAGRVVPADGFPKVVVYGRWKAKSVTSAGDGRWLVDMGVNFAGTYRAVLRNVPAGNKIRFRSGERKNDDGTVNVMTAAAGQIKRPERGPLYAIAEQREEWYSSGAAEAVFEPRFTFHVFRYIQVEGLPRKPAPEDFEALAWSADLKEASSFECSDEKINRLHAMARRTFRSNLQSVQSDCPGREKFGYGGDIAVSAESFRCNWNMRDFYRKTVRDFMDEAADNGLFTETAPFMGIGAKCVIPREETDDRPCAPMGWTLGVPVILDVLVRYDGDLDIVREAYPSLKRFIGIVSKRYPDDDIPACLGDWIAIEKADCSLSALAHWHEFLSKTARFAELIGQAGDAAEFRAHAAKVAEKFRRLYVKKDGRVNKGVQGEQLFAIYHGLLNDADMAPAMRILSADIAVHGNSLTTGMFGTQYLFEILSAHGEAELAGKVLTHEGYPGYYFMMDDGATTIWEHWELKQCLNVHSNCHPMFGSFEQWFVRHVLGICVCADAVGCDKVSIRPNAVCGLSWARGWFDTPKGRISVSWKMVDGRMEVQKSVPAGIEAIPSGR